MLRLRSLAVSLAGLALFGITSAASGPSAAITRAALVPYRDWLLRNAPALCSDLTPSAAATIVPAATRGANCEQTVQHIFAVTPPPHLPRSFALSLHASASHLSINGRRATGIFSLTTSEATEHRRTHTVRIVSLGTHRLTLEEVARRWLVSSPARLVAVHDCQLNPPGHCHANVRDLLLTLGELIGEPGASLPTPAAVRRASRRERREFAAGRTVFVQSGCLACHKIGSDGNPGPGQNLTHVGTRLTPSQIEHVLLSPRAPMPSFKHLPANKLRDLIRFLSLLR